MKLKPDKVLRDRFFTPESYQHPAKGHLGLWWEILERYTKPGEWVLDPMAGVGATMLGALMGRNVICVEKQQHFIEPMRASWAKMRQNPMLGHELGQVLILRGDARALPLGRADCVVTSPPFEDQLPTHHSNTDFSPIGGIRHKAGNSYTRPAAIITSPPYEGALDGHQDGITWDKVQRPNGPHGQGKVEEGYTRPQVDAAIFSPPYGEALSGGGIAGAITEGGNYPITTNRPGSVYSRMSHSIDPENIGNLRGPAYWDAMQQVYSECHRVLKPGGLMALVLKGFTRDGVYQDLPAQTQALCETLGFAFVETWQRELWQLSFWRILQGSEKKATKMGLQMGLTEKDITEVIRTHRMNNGKLDDRLRFETVLVVGEEG